MTKPVLLIIMDGVGISQTHIGDAVTEARTPTLDTLLKQYPNIQLKAHGTAVGLPSDEDMGNSEVGHNALGCGQIYSQGAKLVNESILNGKIYDSPTWHALIDNVKSHHATLHLIGLLSDGNVHSNINHLLSMLQKAKELQVKRVRCHILLDGRDVPATSALTYVDQLESELARLNDANFDAKIASGGGRMKITMDRYQADWKMVENGYNTHVHGIGRQFATATEAIETYRNEFGINDQDLPAFVIAENGTPVGKIQDHDSVILFNFRGDRAIELSMAFDDEAFPYFDRGMRPNVVYAGLLQYDADLNIPHHYLVSSPDIANTLSEVLVQNNIRQFAVSETQKYGHVTYFWNGNRSEKFSDKLETFLQIPSDLVTFDQRPWMKSAEITDAVIEAVQSKKYDFIRCNFPNGDMVGHTGNYEATIISMEALDLALARILAVTKKQNITVLITADHGNADEMFEKDKKGNLQVRTAHSLNPVPFIVVDESIQLKTGEFGLSNVAATVAELLEVKPHTSWNESLLKK